MVERGTMTDIDLFGLKGAHVVITGASGGIGLAVVGLFKELGTKISAQGNRQTSLLPKSESVNAIKADATNEAEVEAFYKEACTKFGSPDVLIVCHGIFEEKEVPIADMNVEQFRRTIDVNLTGTFLFVKHFLRNINASQKPPAVIIVGSTSGRFGEKYHADCLIGRLTELMVDSASKSALHHGFLYSLKNEIVKIHPQGRANIVAPGWVSTPMALKSLKNPSIRNAALATTPMQKIARPEDVTGTIAYLASYNLSGHVSGEIVLANGDVVHASSTDQPDLFYGIASSFGTLGVVTLLKLRLIASKPYVILKSIPVRSIEEAVSVIESAISHESTDYVDGIMYGPECGIIFEGQLVDIIATGTPVRTFTRPKDPWFYLYAKDATNNCESTVTEAIPIVDYLFRYDRGAFWVGWYVFKYFKTPFNCVTRWLLDKFIHTRVMVHALHKSGLSDQYIAQDVGIPYTKVPEFFWFIEREFGFFPIWLSISMDQVDKLINFGVWGPGSRDKHKFVLSNRLIERKVYKLGGVKCLYAHAYYTETEFWKIYDRLLYEKLRSKYHASYLPSVYEKVKVDLPSEERDSNTSLLAWLLIVFWNIWPLGALYGVLHAVKGGDYLLPQWYPWPSKSLWKSPNSS